MKWITTFIVIIGIIACNEQVNKDELISENISKKDIIQYSEDELINLLDSIGRLAPDTWEKDVTSIVDSVLLSQSSFNIKLNTTEYERLKIACSKGEIDWEFAQNIFPNLKLDSIETKVIIDNKLPIKFYSFGENKFNKFAISIGYDSGMFWENDVYFFRENKIISKHEIFHRYGLNLKSFKNENDETVIYYRVNYGSGTGIWWHQNNFYKFDKESLKPVLTEIQNINLQFPWTVRPFDIDAEILNTAPLRIKFIYNNSFLTENPGFRFIKDSTVVEYIYNQQNQIYERIFTESKFNKYKLMSYFFCDTDLPFVNSHIERFNVYLKSKDHKKRQAVLNYLSELKSDINKRKSRTANKR